MDRRLLQRYEEELAFLREMGGEFAKQNPRIAARLALGTTQVDDPYIERLLEGAAFLAARVQTQLDLQFPVFTQNLMEIVYPNFQSPTPSMCVAGFTPDIQKGGMEEGFLLERGTTLRARETHESDTPLVFRTAQDCTLWPLELVDVGYLDAGGVAQAGLGSASGRLAKPPQAAVTLRIKRIGTEPLSLLPLDKLTLYLAGADSEPWKLYEALAGHVVGVAARSAGDGAPRWVQGLPDARIAPRGFEPEEAMLPVSSRTFEGYRLLQEYFALPQRFFFFDLQGLRPAVQRAEQGEIEIAILLDQRLSGGQQLGPHSFDLFAAPAINLFTHRCERISVGGHDFDHAVIPRRTEGRDFEVHSILKVEGIGQTGADDVEFLPFYSSTDLTAAGNAHPAYYMVRRRPWRPYDANRPEKLRRSPRSRAYPGSEVFLSLVDRNQAPYGPGVAQLAVQAWCTNRDLADNMIKGGGTTDFMLPEGGPLSACRVLMGPTNPQAALAEGEAAWRLVSQLSLNYLSIATSDRGNPAAALREMLGVYAAKADESLQAHVDGLVAVASRPVVHRLREAALSTPVRGIEVSLTFDESQFTGADVFLLGAVLNQFFAQYVSMNSFTRLKVGSTSRKEIAAWPPMSGRKALI